MSALLKVFTAGMLNGLIATIGKIATGPFFEAIAERVIIRTLDKIARSTRNTLDDDIVREIKRRLEGQNPRKGNFAPPGSHVR